MLEILGSNPGLGNFFDFVFYLHRHMNSYIRCMYLVYSLYEQDPNQYEQEHVCKYNMYVYILDLNMAKTEKYELCFVYTCL
jgi:hypothetical protein